MADETVGIVFSTEHDGDPLTGSTLMGTYVGLWQGGDAVGYIRPGEQGVRLAPADCVAVVTVQVPA